MALERRRDAAGNHASVLEACPHCGHEFDDGGRSVVEHLPCEETPDTEEVFGR